MITKTVDVVKEFAAAIAAAVDEQGMATEDIARNIHQAATRTQAVKGIIGEVRRGRRRDRSVGRQHAVGSGRTDVAIRDPALRGRQVPGRGARGMGPINRRRFGAVRGPCRFHVGG